MYTLWVSSILQSKRDIYFKKTFTLLQLIKKRLKIQRLTMSPYLQLLIEYIYTRDSRHQSENEKFAENTFTIFKTKP